MENRSQRRIPKRNQKLEEDINEAQRKINELQQAKEDKDQRFVLSPEQQAELAKCAKANAEGNKKLAEDSQRSPVGAIIKQRECPQWMNILAVPLRSSSRAS